MNLHTKGKEQKQVVLITYSVTVTQTRK